MRRSEGPQEYFLYTIINIKREEYFFYIFKER